MTTKLIGLKDFRQNLSGYTRQAQAGDIRFLVMRKNRPVLEVKSVDSKDFILETWTRDIAKARRQVKQGKVYSEEEIMREFGL